MRAGSSPSKRPVVHVDSPGSPRSMEGQVDGSCFGKPERAVPVVSQKTAEEVPAEQGHPKMPTFLQMTGIGKCAGI